MVMSRQTSFQHDLEVIIPLWLQCHRIHEGFAVQIAFGPDQNRPRRRYIQKGSFRFRYADRPILGYMKFAADADFFIDIKFLFGPLHVIPLNRAHPDKRF